MATGTSVALLSAQTTLLPDASLSAGAGRAAGAHLQVGVVGSSQHSPTFLLYPR